MAGARAGWLAAALMAPINHRRRPASQRRPQQPAVVSPAGRAKSESKLSLAPHFPLAAREEQLRSVSRHARDELAAQFGHLSNYLVCLAGRSADWSLSCQLHDHHDDNDDAAPA